MGKYFLPILLLWCFQVWSQTVYLSGDANQIYKLDLNTCQLASVVDLTVDDTIKDLAFDPLHNLFGISNRGNLYRIDLETGTISLVHTFLFLQSFDALICDSEGIFYATGSEGFLYSYDPLASKDRFLGDVGLMTVGDLLFRSDTLYATTIDQKIVQINKQTPSASNFTTTVDGVGLISGLFAFDKNVVACEIPATYGMTHDGKLIAVNLETGVTEELCDLNLSITGAASTFDLSDLVPLTISDFQVNKTQCKMATGSISISALGGTGQLNYFLGERGQPDSIFENLDVGTFLMKVVDENNCTVTQEATVVQTSTPSITDMVVNNAKCPGSYGSVSIVAGGITSLEFSIDQVNFQDSEYFDQISVGHYLITAVDTNGCSAEREFDISSEDLFSIKRIAVTPSSCEANNGSLAITMQSDFPEITFLLDDVTQRDSVFMDLIAGTHQLVISDDMGCEIDTVVQIPDTPCSLYVPNSFSPNDDLVNDQFRVFTSNHADAQINSYQIFDRWGDQIYSAGNFSIHSEYHWWDGTLNGQKLNLGTYIYVIDIIYADGTHEMLKGQVSIVG
jgi:gliding motility-associated-like protein